MLKALFEAKAIALLLAATISLSAQTLGTIARDGRFWVQQETGKIDRVAGCASASPAE